jgi:hypothetical protein
MNAFAETCDPCITSAKLPDSSILVEDGSIPHDANVNDMLQRMTVTVHQQVIKTTTVSESKKHKHGRKARS